MWNCTSMYQHCSAQVLIICENAFGSLNLSCWLSGRYPCLGIPTGSSFLWMVCAFLLTICFSGGWYGLNRFLDIDTENIWKYSDPEQCPRAASLQSKPHEQSDWEEYEGEEQLHGEVNKSNRAQFHWPSGVWAWREFSEDFSAQNQSHLILIQVWILGLKWVSPASPASPDCLSSFFIFSMNSFPPGPCLLELPLLFLRFYGLENSIEQLWSKLARSHCERSGAAH